MIGIDYNQTENGPVRERRFEAGETVYREGDPGDALFVVTEGKVEVLREVGDEEVRLAVLEKGSIFGETGVIRDQPRSTTVRALEDSLMVVIARDTFISAFRDNPFAFKLVQMLCERLAQADRKLIEQRIFSEAATLQDVARIRILPATRDVESQIGTEGLIVEKLPYRVGRRTLSGDATSASKADLAFRAPGSSQLSPLQFAIEDQTGRLMLRDLESHLGTLVNGVRIAHFEESQFADLHFGDNTVAAGGLESPFQFHIVVERAAA